MKIVFLRWQERFAAYRHYKRTILAISRIADSDGLDLGEVESGVMVDARR